MAHTNDDLSTMLRRMTEALDEQRTLIEHQQARLDAQAAELASLRQASPEEPRTSRRKLLGLAGGAAAAAIVASTSHASPAAAANGDAIAIAATTATSTTTPPATLVNYASAGTNQARAFLVSTATGARSSDGLGGAAIEAVSDGLKTTHGIKAYVQPGGVGVPVFGVAGLIGSFANADSAGVYARSEGSGAALYTEASGTSYSAIVGGNGRLNLASYVASGPPVNQNSRGDLVRDSSGNLWFCVTSGVPGVWRKLAGPASAGQLHLLASPVRVIDTRAGTQPTNLNLPKGQLAPATDRTVSLVNGTVNGSATAAVPTGAAGALVNVVVANTVGKGYLAIWSNSIAYPGHSNLNAFGPSQNLAATTVTAIDATANCKIRVSMACDVIIDVIGYYR